MTRKGKPLTRKVGVNFYGFIFLLKRIFLGNFGTKNVLPIRRKHYRLAALLHDVFRKPHRQKGLFETEIIEWSVKIYRVVSLRIKIGVRTL